MRYNAAIAPAEGEMAALLKKAEGPWGELSVENKVQRECASPRPARRRALPRRGPGHGRRAHLHARHIPRAASAPGLARVP